MRLLSDEVLLEAYKHAVELKLDEQFIELLRKEIQVRGLRKENSNRIRLELQPISQLDSTGILFEQHESDRQAGRVRQARFNVHHACSLRQLPRFAMQADNRFSVRSAHRFNIVKCQSAGNAGAKRFGDSFLDCKPPCENFQFSLF